jgi:hypothetical protein
MTLMGPLRYEHPPHLPPVTVAPILERYDPDLRRVENAYRLEAPIDDRGVVGIFKTVELALSLVDGEYIWPRDEPEPDVHHFVWERDWYHPRHFNGSQIPRDYRDKVSFHKGYLPRQLHDFMHAVIAPPPVPDFSVMEARVRDFDIALALFESARGAITARRKPGKIAGVPISSKTGEILLNDEILLQIMTNFEDYFENSKADVVFGNEFIDSDLINHPPEVVARHLGRVAGHNALNLMPLVYKNRRRAKVRMAA